MSGTHDGGLKVNATLLEKLGSPEAVHQWRVEQGRKGGKAPKTKPSGFAANRALASEAGRRGGRASRRGPAR